MRKNCLFIILLFIAIGAAGQNVKIDAEIRTRGELRDGFREPKADSVRTAFVNNLRTKVNLQYESESVKAKVSLIDTRTYGATDVGRTGNGLGILEAWGEYRFSPAFSLALGRQGVEYDDKRLFAYNNWSNTPGAHDLLYFKYKTEGFAVHFGSAYNNAGDSIQFLAPYRVAYKTLNFLRLEKSLGTKLAAAAMWINDAFEGGTTGDIWTAYRNTLGANLWSSDRKAPFSFIAYGYYQFGHDRQNRSLSAYLLAAEARLRLSPKWSVKAGGDLFSGSKSDIDAGKNNTFNKLYGTNHFFNGSIEFWSTLPSQGLVDIFVGATAEFSPKFNIDFTFHNFSASQDINEAGKRALGSEIDILANYTVNKVFAVQAGWSGYFTSEGSDILKRKVGVQTRFPQWAYIQLTFKPVFTK